MKTNFVLFGLLGLVLSASAQATTIIDTGTPDNSASAIVVSSAQYIAGQVNFAQDYTLNSIQAYLQADLGTGTGDTFNISLYSDNGNKVGSLIDDDTATATFSADGWNGLTNLNWNVSAGTYWIAVEEKQDNVNFIAPEKVSNPLVRTALYAGSNYQNTSTPMPFGLQVNATVAVPEADSTFMMLAGLGLLGLVARRRLTA